MKPDPPQPDSGDLAPWFHNLHLPDGTQTAPDHFLGDFPRFKWEELEAGLPTDLTGWRCLDIGCNAGFYSIELARRGASVLSLDHDEHYLAQADWAIRRFGLIHAIELRNLPVYELDQLEETFDLVLFLGVMYHLRYPLLGLDLAAGRSHRLLAFQTLTMPGGEGESVETGENPSIHQREAMRQEGWPKMAFIEHRLAGDPTNWWAANEPACEAMLRSAGLRILDRPGHEMWLCEKADQAPSA